MTYGILLASIEFSVMQAPLRRYRLLYVRVYLYFFDTGTKREVPICSALGWDTTVPTELGNNLTTCCPAL
jgi:hypothetical protein